MDFDAIVVGGGAAGLTCAAYLCRGGRRVLLCEKNSKTGGLVNAFQAGGFHFDGGIRAFENSGIVFPMLRQLGIDLPVQRSPVAIGIEGQVLRLSGRASLDEYQKMLTGLFPAEESGITAVIALIRKVIEIMDVLYGIDNPLFLDIGQPGGPDRAYLTKTLLPWLLRYQLNIRKALRLKEPVNDLMRRHLHDESLIDLITQHFFTDTPAFFALSYFGLYLDYSYPIGGTDRLAKVLERYVRDNGGEIRLSAAVTAIHPDQRKIVTEAGETFGYRELIWAADAKALYRALDLAGLADKPRQTWLAARRDLLLQRPENNSILTLFLGIDQTPDWFAEHCGAHMFFTPDHGGLHQLPAEPAADQTALRPWLQRLFALTTYEISCPALRDASLAPTGKTGLIISLLFDSALTRRIAEAGWYDEFKEFAADTIVEVLDRTLLPGIGNRVVHRQVATPLTLESLTGNSGGAVTGWAFRKKMWPVENRFPKIRQSIRTPIRGIWQAGAWTFSPSGLPVSILTGKLAADAALKNLTKQTRKMRMPE